MWEADCDTRRTDKHVRPAPVVGAQDGATGGDDVDGAVRVRERRVEGKVVRASTCAWAMGAFK